MGILLRNFTNMMKKQTGICLLKHLFFFFLTPEVLMSLLAFIGVS